MKPRLSPYIWSSTPPRRAGLYWYKQSEDSEAEILRVFKVKGEVEWSYQWGIDREEDIDWVYNAHGAVWAGPIPEPRAPRRSLEVTDSTQCI